MQTDKLGCFGSALCHQPASEPCRSCDFRADCGVASSARAATLREKYGVSKLLGINEANTRRGREKTTKSVAL